MTIKTDIIAKANEIIALANQIDEGGGTSPPPPPPPPSRTPLNCLPNWTSTGAVTGWNLAVLPSGFPDNQSADLNAYDAACNSAPTAPVVCFGDSITQRNTFSNISNKINLGYGGEAMRRALYRLSTRPAHVGVFERAAAIVWNSGVNDLGYFFSNHPPELAAQGGVSNGAIMVGDYHYKDLAAKMAGKWVILGILPIDEEQATLNTGTSYAGYNAELALMNQKMQASLEAHATSAQYVFIDPASIPGFVDAQGNMKDEHQALYNGVPDAIHPNENCYNTLINPIIGNALVSLGVAL